MASYETRTQYPALAAFSDVATIWEAETTATVRDLRAGEAVASVGSAMTLVGTGTPTSQTAAIDVKIERGGYPDGSAAFLHKLSSASDYASWDAPTEVGYIEAASWSTSEPQSIAYLACATLPDGRVVFVAEYNSAGTSTFKIRVRETDGTYTTSATSSSAVMPSARTPQVVAPGDGWIRVYWLDHNTVQGVTQIAMMEARDDATSATYADFSAFGTVQRNLLDNPLEKSGVIFAYGLQLVAGGGQHLACVELDGDLYQAASNDGIAFRSIGLAVADAKQGFGLGYVAGAFLLGYGDTTTGSLRVRSVGSAASSISSAEPVVLDTSHYTPSNLDKITVVRGYDDTAWLYSSSDNASATTGVGVVYTSRDGGATWDAAASWRDGNRYSAQCATWWRDRVLMFVGADGDLLTYEDSITCLHLGGWTLLPMPRRLASPTKIGSRVAFNASWIPTEKLNNTFAVTITGTVTESFGAAYYNASCTGSGNSIVVRQSNSAEYPSISRFAVHVIAGTTDYLTHVEKAGSQYAIKVAITNTGFTVTDVGAGTTAATVTFADSTKPHEFMVWADGSSSTVWYREWALSTPSTWIHVIDETLSSTTASPLAQFALNGSGGLQTARVYAFSAYYQSALYGGAFDTYGESVNRDDVTVGAPVSLRPLYTQSGYQVSGYSGPARVGDTWAIEADSPTPIAMAQWDRDYPSPSDRWKSNTATQEIIAWQFHDAAAVSIGSVWALVYAGDVSRIAYSWHDGTSWSGDTTVDTSFSGGFRRRGDTLVPVTGYAITAGPFVEADELVGGFVVDSGNRARRITANTSGVLWPSATAKLAIITIDGDGTETSSTSSWKVYFPRSSVVINNATGYARGFRVKVSPSGYTYTPNGYPDLKVLFGPAVVLGLPHGMDTTVEHVGSARSWQAANGRRRSAQAAPTSRTVTLTWQSTLDRLWQVQGDKPTENEPDSIEVNSLPVYSRGEAASTIRAFVDRHAANGTPVAYIPRGIDVSAGASQPARGPHRSAGVVVGTLDPLWVVEHAGTGEEQRDEVVRLGALVIRELT